MIAQASPQPRQLTSAAIVTKKNKNKAKRERRRENKNKNKNKKNLLSHEEVEERKDVVDKNRAAVLVPVNQVTRTAAPSWFDVTIVNGAKGVVSKVRVLDEAGVFLGC